MKRKLISMLLIALSSLSAAWCNEDIKIYPVSKVFTSEQVNKQNPHFKKVLLSNSSVWIAYYKDSIKQHFENIETEITEANKYKTFAAFLNIPRVSKNNYNKGKLQDIYLPMTMSINFFNTATSEMLYSYPFTYYAVYETTQDLLKNQAYSDKVIGDLYDDTFKKLTDTLVQKASEEFKPFSIEAKITDKYKNLYVLDKGKTSGIAKGDLLSDDEGNQLSVIYSNLDYSIAKFLIGSPSNKAFRKYANSSLAQLKKPKVLFLNTIQNDKNYNIFSSTLGSGADFALMNNDKTFFAMQEEVALSNSKYKYSNTQNRTMPDYFLKLYMTKPLYTQYPSGNAGINTDKYGMIACGVIFDKTGKVIYSKCDTEENEQQVVSDVKFSDEAKIEVIAKNILTKLAGSFASEVKFKETEFKIAKVKDGNIFIQDKVGLLSIGNTLTVFKKISSEKGKMILMPTWEYKIFARDNGFVECKPMRPYADGFSTPSTKDKAIMTLASKGAGRELFTFYPDNMKLENSEVELKFFKNIAFASLASVSKYPMAVDGEDFAREIEKLNSGYGFKNKLQMPEYDNRLKIRPVYQIKLLNEKEKKSLLERKYEVIVGIVSYNGDEVIKKDGIKQEVTVFVPKEDSDQALQYELLKIIYPLLQKVALKF